VQRSTDGIHFTSLNKILATGNTASTVSYTMTDHSPVQGINYYRIAQIDRNGKMSYSPVRTLEFEKLRNFITITPNPAKDELLLTIHNNTDRLYVTLVNVIGETMMKYTISREKNQLDVSNLPSGIYFLKINGGQINEVRKLVKK
jgi:hypothetical protein